jgi:hypothetical protein
MRTGTRKIRTKIQLVRTNPGTQTPKQINKIKTIEKKEKKRSHTEAIRSLTLAGRSCKMGVWLERHRQNRE